MTNILQDNPLKLWNRVNKFLKEKGVIEKMLKNKDELEDNLIQTIQHVKTDKKKVEKIKKGMLEYGLSGGETLKYIDHAQEEIPNINDLRLLCLLTEQVYLASADMNVNPDEYFTELGRKKSKIIFSRGGGNFRVTLYI